MEKCCLGQQWSKKCSAVCLVCTMKDDCKYQWIVIGMYGFIEGKVLILAQLGRGTLLAYTLLNTPYFSLNILHSLVQPFFFLKNSPKAHWFGGTRNELQVLSWSRVPICLVYRWNCSRDFFWKNFSKDLKDDNYW